MLADLLLALTNCRLVPAENTHACIGNGLFISGLSTELGDNLAADAHVIG